MKIFSKQNIYDADKQTIKNQNITSEVLMERAATQVFKWLKKNLPENTPVINILCGVGNNGGDGLAIARMLLNENYKVEVFIVNFSEKRSDDFLHNLDKLKQKDVWPNFINKDSDFPDFKANQIVIDAIFGIGLNRPPEKWLKDFIKKINQSKAYVVAIDIPSGLYLDAVPKDKDGILIANTTVSFQLPKLIFFLPETANYCGNLQIIPIGLDEKFIAETPTEAILITPREVTNLYRPRQKYAHKGTFGHCLVVGGSYGKMGSVCLSTKAALRSGAGKVTALIPNCGYEILQSSVPEAMTISSETENYLAPTQLEFKPNVICFGIGADTKKETVAFLKNLLKTQKSKFLIDADGLNILAENKELLDLLPKDSILTPHPGELKRLIGEWEDDFDKLEKAKAFAEKYSIILVIKGANTISISNQKMYVNTSGNPGMATAGSGDVLTGVIGGLLAQGYSPDIATVFGIYLHGKAGDEAAKVHSFEAMIAGDVIANLGKSFQSLFENNQ